VTDKKGKSTSDQRLSPSASSTPSTTPPIQKGPWQQLSSQEVYDNPWIALSHQQVLTPAGEKGIYGVIHFKNIAVGIIPVDSEANTWLVKQFRYPLEKYSWEIPEGGCPESEVPLATAKRELMEETGLAAEEWTELMVMDLSNSVSDERAVVFVAEQLTEGTANPEGTEDIESRKLALSEALKMVFSGEITDAISVAALMRLYCKRPELFSETPKVPGL